MGDLKQVKEAASTANDSVGMAGNVLQGADVGGLSPRLAATLPGTVAKAKLGSAMVNPGTPPGAMQADYTELIKTGGRQANGVRTAFSGLGALTSMISAIGGGRDMLDDSKETDDRVVGGLNLLSGTIGTVGGIAGLSSTIAGGSGFLSGLASVGGAQGLAATGTAAFGAGASTTAMAAGTALASTGALISAGTAGYGLGKFGDQTIKDLNLPFMRDENGRARSISEAGSDYAVGVHDRVSKKYGETAGMFAGGAASIGTSILGVPLAIAGAGAGFSRGISNGVGALADWVTGK